MKILAGSIVRQRPKILAGHMRTMLWQETDAEIDYFYINDLDPDEPDYTETSDVLFGHKDVEIWNTDIDDRPSGAEYVAAQDTHHWQMATFEWLGSLRQKFLDKVVEEGYDFGFLVDSDLLLDPRCLQSLIDCDKPITSAVFWTKWQPGAPPLPQVWLKHPYGLSGRGWKEHEFLQELSNGALVRVYGLGACTLFKASVLDKVSYHPLLQGLPIGGMWQGEDRSFCIRAERAHVEMWADSWPNIWHCYRPGQEEKIPQILDVLPAMNKESEPNWGDFVSVTTECTSPLKLRDPDGNVFYVPPIGHIEHVRGRLGKIPVMEEIEDALMEMKPGGEALVKVNYPHWHNIADLRGTTKVIRVKLRDVKHARQPKD